MSGGSPSTTSDLLAQRSYFEGTIVATLAYGALLMLYIQLTQVLLSRPKRGNMYLAIVAYSTVLFCLATIAIGGMIRYTEISYVDNRNFEGGPHAYYASHLTNKIHVMGQTCTTLVPWIGDILMLYRLYVVWDSNRSIVVFPALLYMARVAMSVPLLISQTRPADTWWATRTHLYSTTFYALCVSLNLFVSIAISLRIYMMRRKVEAVMGKLHASFYSGYITMIVESGAFFTLWGLTYIILMSRNNSSQNTFLLPYTEVLGITRMLIVLRMSQDRAWSKELTAAITGGVVDWQVSSTYSMPLHDIPASSEASLHRKYQESL